MTDSCKVQFGQLCIYYCSIVYLLLFDFDKNVDVNSDSVAAKRREQSRERQKRYRDQKKDGNPSSGKNSVLKQIMFIASSNQLNFGSDHRFLY